jgi:hypothetical protein
MKITVKITKDILEKSKSCPFLRTCTEEEVDIVKSNCAFSVAWREIFPDAVVFQGSTILIPGYGIIPHSKDIIKYIQDFDNCETEKERANLPEASFTFDIHDYIIDSIGIDQVNEILSKSQTLEKV